MAPKKKKNGDVLTATIGGQWVKNARIQNAQLINGQKKIKNSQKKGFFKTIFNLKSFILCGLLIPILCWLYSQSRTVSLNYLDHQGMTHTLALPAKDRKRLSMLMQKLFAQGSFAYTILGSKPVSWETYLKPLPLSNWERFRDSFSEHHRTIRSGWKTWKKYQHLFSSMCLIAESSKYNPSSISILIINEDRFNEVVNSNIRDFQETLSRKIKDGYQLIKEAENRSLIDEILQEHQGLIGIVLGYGRDNSWQFFEGSKNHKAIGWVWEEENSYFTEAPIDSGISLTDYYLSRYSCPSFAGEPNSAESLALKLEYILTRQKVIEYYRGKDFLEATLSLLAGYRP